MLLVPISPGAAAVPVSPAPDGTIFCEAEEFNVASPGWRAGKWGENYYAATFANCFLSRKAFLGAPAEGARTVATIDIDVKEPGRYAVLARYEAAYRFQTQFHIKVQQKGQTKLDRLYGARENLKIWAFSQKLKTEVAWPWGAVENVVWEGHDAFADLEAGLATISLIADAQPAPAAKRNVDLVMLTRDVEQVNNRIENEKYLPLDGWLTQQGDAWLKVHNAGGAKVTVTCKPVQEHSPYWVHMRNWKPVTADVEAGQTSAWIEVGGTLDALNDGQWRFNTTGPCKLEFGLRNREGLIESLRTIEASGDLELIGPADLRYSRSIRTTREGMDQLIAHLKGLPVHGKTPSQTLIYAATHDSLAEQLAPLYGLAGKNTYTDLRGKSPAQLEESCGKLTPEQRSAIRVVSLGDEIGLPQPPADTAQDGFAKYLQAQGLKPADVDPAAGDDWGRIKYNIDKAGKTANPGVYYWSTRYLHHYGIQEQKKLTDTLRAQLPQAHIGANFSPHHGGSVHTFLGETFKWVNCFRDDGMTLPWAEDYIWQVPVGSPQMNGINLDMFRAGLRGKSDRKILYYVMPHAPGNTPAMWRRLFHNAVGHGATILNLFCFEPVWVGYTENHVTGDDMYAMILRTFRELGLYEDILQAGAVRPAQTGLWFSETADIWGDNEGSFGSAKRGLYTAILHQQVPLDFIVEQDAGDGTLDQYKALYLTDKHVTRSASQKIAAWVERGGVLFATAGAGMFDELNQPNTAMRALLGVELTQLESPETAQVLFIKQDLPFAQPITTATWSDKTLSAFGAIAKMNARDAQVVATFADGSPAMTIRKVGKGQAIACALLPALSYYKPAIPMIPLDRGSTDDAMAHLLPVKLDAASSELIRLPLTAAGVTGPAIASAPLIETNIITSPKGTALVVTNWSGRPHKVMTLTLDFAAPTGSVTLASGGRIAVSQSNGKTVLTFDLDLADVVIMR